MARLSDWLKQGVFLVSLALLPHFAAEAAPKVPSLSQLAQRAQSVREFLLTPEGQTQLKQALRSETGREELAALLGTESTASLRGPRAAALALLDRLSAAPSPEVVARAEALLGFSSTRSELGEIDPDLRAMQASLSSSGGRGSVTALAPFRASRGAEALSPGVQERASEAGPNTRSFMEEMAGSNGRPGDVGEVEPALVRAVDETVRIAWSPVLPRHALLWGLVEVYAELRVAPQRFMAGAALFVPLVGPLMSFGHTMDAERAKAEARREANRIISRDAGMQYLSLLAYGVGRHYQGEVPEPIVQVFADAFDDMARDLPDWYRGKAFEFLSVQGARRPDGFERLRWDSRQLQEFVRNPAQFIKDEIVHTRYTITDTARHLAGHRLSGLRALLQNRPLDALTLQAIGDLDTFDQDYH